MQRGVARGAAQHPSHRELSTAQQRDRAALEARGIAVDAGVADVDFARGLAGGVLDRDRAAVLGEVVVQQGARARVADEDEFGAVAQVVRPSVLFGDVAVGDARGLAQSATVVQRCATTAAALDRHLAMVFGEVSGQERRVECHRRAAAAMDAAARMGRDVVLDAAVLVQEQVDGAFVVGVDVHPATPLRAAVTQARVAQRDELVAEQAQAAAEGRGLRADDVEVLQYEEVHLRGPARAQRGLRQRGAPGQHGASRGTAVGAVDVAADDGQALVDDREREIGMGHVLRDADRVHAGPVRRRGGDRGREAVVAARRIRGTAHREGGRAHAACRCEQQGRGEQRGGQRWMAVHAEAPARACTGV